MGKLQILALSCLIVGIAVSNGYTVSSDDDTEINKEIETLQRALKDSVDQRDTGDNSGDDDDEMLAEVFAYCQSYYADEEFEDCVESFFNDGGDDGDNGGDLNKRWFRIPRIRIPRIRIPRIPTPRIPRIPIPRIPRIPRIPPPRIPRIRFPWRK